jgi:hypothetical protein
MVSEAVIAEVAVVPAVICNTTQSAKDPVALFAAVSTPVVNVPVTARGEADVKEKALAGAVMPPP